MSAESHHMTEPANLSAAADVSEGDAVSRWVAQLEERVRRSPREAVLVAFLVGGLLQVFAVRSLLINLVRLALSLATPILFGVAAWRLYESFEGNESLRRSSIRKQRTATK
jgi:predicted alpha/beta hydrolase family esterase